MKFYLDIAKKKSIEHFCFILNNATLLKCLINKVVCPILISKNMDNRWLLKRIYKEHFKSMRKQLKNNGLIVNIWIHQTINPLPYSLSLLSNTKNTFCPNFKPDFNLATCMQVDIYIIVLGSVITIWITCTVYMKSQEWTEDLNSDR